MAGRWNTQRGDDWWFSGGSIVADGAHSPAPMFEITRIAGSPIAPGALQELLAQTLEQFSGSKILVVLDNSTRPALDALARDSAVVWQEFKQPYSLWAHVLSVVPPNNSFKPSPLRGLGPTGSASGGPA